MTQQARTIWTFAITSIALFMVVLDNLVVSTALPVIRSDLGATIEELEWTVNAYTLTFAVFLLTGAALGDRFGRKRMFAVGVAVFTGASAAAALAPSMDWLIAARAVRAARGPSGWSEVHARRERQQRALQRAHRERAEAARRSRVAPMQLKRADQGPARGAPALPGKSFATASACTRSPTRSTAAAAAWPARWARAATPALARAARWVKTAVRAS